MRHPSRNDYYVAGCNVNFYAGGAGFLTVEGFRATEDESGGALYDSYISQKLRYGCSCSDSYSREVCTVAFMCVGVEVGGCYCTPFTL